MPHKITLAAAVAAILIMPMSQSFARSGGVGGVGGMAGGHASFGAGMSRGMGAGPAAGFGARSTVGIGGAPRSAVAPVGPGRFAGTPVRAVRRGAVFPATRHAFVGNPAFRHGHFRFRHHRAFFPFVAPFVGAAVVADTCWRWTPTPYGWRRVWVCGYPYY